MLAAESVLSVGMPLAQSRPPCDERSHCAGIMLRSDRDLLLLVTVLSQALFALVSGHLVALTFLSAWHCSGCLWLVGYAWLSAMNALYRIEAALTYLLRLFFTSSRNTFEGLKAGI